MIKTYTELISFETFDERLEYLKIEWGRPVGFQFDRYLSQLFYKSRLWRDLRNKIILRDGGCCLACPGYEIHDRVIIHHMNPLTEADLRGSSLRLIDPEGLITVSHATHNAIHILSKGPPYPNPFVIRKQGDQTPWGEKEVHR